MITDKLVNALLESAMASFALLERLEAKVDAQAIGKLRGAFRSLQMAGEKKKGTELAVQMALGSFTESAEYFRSLIASLNGELSFDRKFERRSKVGKILGWGKFAAGSVRDLLGLGQGRLNKMLWHEIERIDCINLLMLAEIGRIACMAELDFEAKIVSRDLDLLRSIDFDVDSDPFLERIVELGLLPAHVAGMESREFVRHYGAVLKPDDVRSMDERDEMKAFVIEHYGTMVSDIKQNNPAGYKSFCLQAGREPVDVDDYVDMVMAHSAENDGLLDKMEDWGEKKILYWADKDMLDKWAQAFFRYASLQTVLKACNHPRRLFASVAAGALAGG
ncbi:MAG: hypothetical protein KKA54_15180 [Proteobacteria bacterium]|nr:hypothetical protein [Pseudomonadota bacterium]MBU0967713.1 hypothetical protein [Pseudomonadota bacterium]